MNFATFLNQAWKDHAKQTVQVATRLQDGFNLVETPEDMAEMARLITHVMGEHLGQWAKGIELLNELRRRPVADDPAFARSIASLELAGGTRATVENFSKSDQVRIFAVAATAVAGQRDFAKARILMDQAVASANEDLPTGDPALRALAVMGNNLASTLEEKSDLSSSERELMISAAKVARKFWELAGTWREVLWAEYRLACSYLKAADFKQSRSHALEALNSAREHEAPALEMFFAFEALTAAEFALHQRAEAAEALEGAKAQFEKLSAEDQAWCADSLQKIVASTTLQ